MITEKYWTIFQKYYGRKSGMTQNTFHGKIDRNVVTIGRKNMGKKTDKSTVGLILGFVKRMQEDHIGAYAAQAAYFFDHVVYSFCASAYGTGSVYTIDISYAQTGNPGICSIEFTGFCS